MADDHQGNTRGIPRPSTGPSVRSRTIARSSTRQTGRTSIAKPTRTISSLGQAAPGTNNTTSTEQAAATNAAKKRKTRDFEPNTVVEQSGINVVVRCRGRSETELREASNMVTTEGVKGEVVDVLSASNASTRKKYTFDRVYSPAADQSMIYNDTVRPILDEMLAGYNCTIFAYGQTGTGKTYTMSGDMSNVYGILNDAAGIIPRVLQSLFRKLDATENCVKVSFVELYNEELRDLISTDDSAALRIYEDVSRKGHSTTIVQGMEERHIKDAAEGIKVLQDGSQKREVAATKCNSLSSRSHTIFTITTYVQRDTEGATEEYVQAGKLNLVDLAGSENIQRSGAENKRATEAGLINKSLLTLGRVINALVDGSVHIPYRESKLTRLLQDSLGGRTKTCIIATISQADSNLEETLSTLDYAFRAKNIQNKPQLNQPFSRNKLLTDFTHEIERLKEELRRNRQRNGVYLSNDAYDDMNNQAETQKIMLEEQSAKLEIMESNLRNKTEDVFAITSTLMGLKADHENTAEQLEQTRGALNEIELALGDSRKSLAQEVHIRNAYQETEAKLVKVGADLISTVRQTTTDIANLHRKDRQRSEIESTNKIGWDTAQGQVFDITSTTEQKLLEVQEAQNQAVSDISHRVQLFIDDEAFRLESKEALVSEQVTSFGNSRDSLLELGRNSKEAVDQVLQEVNSVMEAVKKQGAPHLEHVSTTVEGITTGVVSEVITMQQQLDTSYGNLNTQLKLMVGELVSQLDAQRCESNTLRQQLRDAAETMMEQNKAMSQKLQTVVEDERRQAATDRQDLLTQIACLINSQATVQESRLAEKTAAIQDGLDKSNTSLQGSINLYSDGVAALDTTTERLLDKMQKSSLNIYAQIENDRTTATNTNCSVQATAKKIHPAVVAITEEYTRELNAKSELVEGLVSRAQTTNSQNHNGSVQRLQSMTREAEISHMTTLEQFLADIERLRQLGSELDNKAAAIKCSVDAARDDLCAPLSELRGEMARLQPKQYESTGMTPPKKRKYDFPTELPSTVPHETLLAAMQSGNVGSPNKGSAGAFAIFSDGDRAVELLRSPTKNLGAPVSNPLGTKSIDSNAATEHSFKSLAAPGSGLKWPGADRHGMTKRAEPHKLGKPVVVRAVGRENLDPDLQLDVNIRNVY
ncbi:P-loop containing nucleoside triphosphate hydrolase protein [Xylariales sp. PMI_506]|nr:P-loop containing nucleoside triphosphate hydrolase protein [Xylariales sp. PMI_506]